MRTTQRQMLNVAARHNKLEALLNATSTTDTLRREIIRHHYEITGRILQRHENEVIERFKTNTARAFASATEGTIIKKTI